MAKKRRQNYCATVRYGLTFRRQNTKAMKTKVVKIGKSYGVILPESFAKNLGRRTTVEIANTPQGIVIDPLPNTDFYDVNTVDDIFLFTDLSHELELED